MCALVCHYGGFKISRCLRRNTLLLCRLSTLSSTSCFHKVPSFGVPLCIRIAWATLYCITSKTSCSTTWWSLFAVAKSSNAIVHTFPLLFRCSSTVAANPGNYNLHPHFHIYFCCRISNHVIFMLVFFCVFIFSRCIPCVCQYASTNSQVSEIQI